MTTEMQPKLQIWTSDTPDGTIVHIELPRPGEFSLCSTGGHLMVTVPHEHVELPDPTEWR